MRIHPSSVISSRAKIGRDVEIGPFCVIEDNVSIGDGCRIEARVTVKSGTYLGENNQVSDGAVLGGAPQHIAAHDVCGQLVIGNGNIFRENCTVHRAMKESEATVIGNDNMLMVNTHVAHDCRLGDNIILANNAMLAGHVSVSNRANISGAVGVHQFCRIGTLAMLGGQAHIIQDVPPFMTVDGLSSRIVGLNLIGLRRAGLAAEDIKQLKAAYRILYRSQKPWREILTSLEESFQKGPALQLVQF
ncbi:MAG: acyl-ACP--UDP-N-acetylglucosamine O-acyltransferase, partial [Thermoguttaceae bacterium]